MGGNQTIFMPKKTNKDKILFIFVHNADLNALQGLTEHAECTLFNHYFIEYNSENPKSLNPRYERAKQHVKLFLLINHQLENF